MEIEITKTMDLTDEQKSLIDMHSFLNVMNVLIGELSILGVSADKASTVRPAIDLGIEIADSLHIPHRALDCARNFNSYDQTIRDCVAELLDTLPVERRGSSAIADSVSNIESVLSIIKVRIREILARAEEPEGWIRHDIDSLMQNFSDVLAAIEKNAKGRYHIRYNVADQLDDDYVVNFRIDSVDGKSINMPPALQDVIRDLIANARKYTPPGGCINAGLTEDGEALHLAVSDTGIGIPADEIESSVEFGKRATNVSELVTNGGGFGLTKAYLVTRQFGGRMWISSKLGFGTKIRIEIPLADQPTLIS